MRRRPVWQRACEVDRATWMTGAGSLLLIAGAISTWSAHPSAARSSLSLDGALQLTSETYAIDLFLRAGTFAAGVLFLGVAWRGAASRRWPLRLAWLLPAVALAYPCWMAHYQPERLFERSLLHHELHRVASDMDENLSQQQVDWRGWQTFAGRTASNIPLIESESTWHPGYFSAANLNRVTEELLGLSPAFLAFFRPALVAVLAAGTISVLYGLHLAHPGGLPAVWRGMGFGSLAVSLLLAAPLGPRLVAELDLIAAESALRRGNQAVALERLQAAQSGKPALAHSWAHHQRLGRLALLRDRPTSLEFLLAEAFDALTKGRPRVAVDRLELARSLHPQTAMLDHYLAVALSEAAIEALGSGQAGVAQEYWQESLRYLPTNPTAWYGLSIIDAQQQRYGEAAQALDHVAQLQGYLGYRRMVTRAQALVMVSWAAFQRGDLASSHRLYSRSLRPETW